MKKLILIVALGLAVVVVAAGCAKPTPAPKPATESTAEFYKKNTLEVISPYAAGGSSDTSARLMSTYWPKVTGGGNMIVKNVTGAGGITGNNFVYNSKPDGLTIGTGNFGSQISTALFKDPAVKHDPTKVNWLWGAFYTPWLFTVAAPKPYNSLADVQKAKGLKFGNMKREDAGVLFQAFAIDALKIDGKIVLGYEGTNEVGLAAGRGEIDGTVTNAMSHGIQFEKGFYKKPSVILDRKRTEFWPDVPTIFEVVKLTPQQEQLFGIIEAITSSAQPLYTPPGVPDDRVKFLRQKFGEIMADQEFRKAGEKYWKVWTEPKTAEEMKAMATKALAVSQQDVTSMGTLVDKYLLSK